MSVTVCLAADALGYPEGGGHLWVYLNWALGLHANGCRVIWLEGVGACASSEAIRANIARLRERLAQYGMRDCLALSSRTEEPLPRALRSEALDLVDASEADLLLNLRYGMRSEVVERFRRSALVDIDPGLLQVWMSSGQLSVVPHDVYFTIGETVGRPGAGFPDAGVAWHYTPPCVAIERWPVRGSTEEAPFTTVSHWQADEWMQDPAGKGAYRNDKRSGFLPYMDLPRYTCRPLEMALCLGAGDDVERRQLEGRGWRIRDARAVASTPEDYQCYVQRSRGEFSCAKPSCIRLQNAWISDRTLCYLASGKPAVVQHTGPSRFLPEAEGLFRFRNLAEAVRSLEAAEADYARHSKAARALVERFFSAREVTGKVLERALM